MMSDLTDRLKELRHFLSGEAELEGKSFGDKVNLGKFKASFWWRKELTRIDEAITALESREE